MVQKSKFSDWCDLEITLQMESSDNDSQSAAARIQHAPSSASTAALHPTVAACGDGKRAHRKLAHLPHFRRRAKLGGHSLCSLCLLRSILSRARRGPPREGRLQPAEHRCVSSVQRHNRRSHGQHFTQVRGEYIYHSYLIPPTRAKEALKMA